MKIELLSWAESDLSKGSYFYERQQIGLGNYFIDSLLADIESLQIHAGVHPRYQGFHRLLAKRFPFAIYYKVREESVQIYAILDCRADPKKAIQFFTDLASKGL